MIGAAFIAAMPAGKRWLGCCFRGSVCAGVLLWGAPAWATQAHGGPEGLHVHQMAHVFFAFSMGLLIYWLRKWRLSAVAGWRSIKMSALFFILWNVDAFATHWLEEQSALLQVQRLEDMRISLVTAPGYDWIGLVYYFCKLDHLLSVPALFFLCIGLRRLLKSPPAASGFEDPAS